MKTTRLLRYQILALALPVFACQAPSETIRPNLVVIFCDDLGYGDLGTFGHPTIRTPNLDRMAQEGQKWTHFYAAASVCTPSRAALLTGRLPVRNGMMSPKSRVLFPDSASGIPENEVTLAEALRAQGYATGCVGKWHLGHLPQYLPTNNGFDSYFGIPYSNDMDQTRKGSTRDLVKTARIEYWNVPLLRDQEVVERPADQRTITKRYSEEAVRFIRENRERPFFLYLAHNLPHVPLFASEEFLGTSKTRPVRRRSGGDRSRRGSDHDGPQRSGNSRAHARGVYLGQRTVASLQRAWRIGGTAPRGKGGDLGRGYAGTHHFLVARAARQGGRDGDWLHAGPVRYVLRSRRR